MTTITLPDWLRPQTISPPMVQRAVSASVGRYTQTAEFGDWMQGDTWAMSIGIAPHSLADAGRVEALVDKLVGGVNSLQCHHFARPVPRGTARGTLTLSAAVAQGALALPVTGATSLPNVTKGGSFEIDTNSDGLADGLTAFSSGSVSSVLYAAGPMVGPTGSRSQRVQFTSLGTADGDRAGFFFDTLYATDQPAGPYACSVYAAAISAVKQKMQVDFINASNVVVGSTGQVAANGISAALRLSGVGAPASAWRRVRVYLWATSASAPQSDFIWFDSVQVEPGSVATDYSSFASYKAGDMLGAGGMLFKVADDTSLSDAGAGSVPVVNRARAAIASGSAVVWDKPTALWWLKNRPVPNINPGYADGLVLELVERAI